MNRLPVRPVRLVRSWRGGGRRDERGSMAVEVVLLTPVLMLFVMLVVVGGRYVSVHGDVEAASRDAARAASMTRSYGEAQLAAASVADWGLDDDTSCTPADISGSDFTEGGMVRVTLGCVVSYDDLGLIGVPGSTTITVTSTAPLDTYRRTG